MNILHDMYTYFTKMVWISMLSPLRRVTSPTYILNPNDSTLRIHSVPLIAIMATEGNSLLLLDLEQNDDQAIRLSKITFIWVEGKKPLNKSIIQSVLRNLFDLDRLWYVNEVEKGIFIFSFDSKSYYNSVHDRRPWSVNRVMRLHHQSICGVWQTQRNNILKKLII